MTYIIRRLSEIRPREITCGTAREITNGNDLASVNFIHVVLKGESKKHYHDKTTEAYYVLKGEIEMELDGRKESCPAGTLIMIIPPTKHKMRQVSKEAAEVLVASSPAWRASDEFVIE